MNMALSDCGRKKIFELNKLQLSTMRAVKATGRVDEWGQIHLDQPLVDVNGRVEVIILMNESELKADRALEDVDIYEGGSI